MSSFAHRSLVASMLTGTVTGTAVVVTISGSFIHSELRSPTVSRGASPHATATITIAKTQTVRAVNRCNS